MVVCEQSTELVKNTVVTGKNSSPGVYFCHGVRECLYACIRVFQRVYWADEFSQLARWCLLSFLPSEQYCNNCIWNSLRSFAIFAYRVSTFVLESFEMCGITAYIGFDLCTTGMFKSFHSYLHLVIEIHLKCHMTMYKIMWHDSFTHTHTHTHTHRWTGLPGQFLNELKLNCTKKTSIPRGPKVGFSMFRSVNKLCRV